MQKIIPNKIGIYGGSFSPITKGHIRLSNYLVEHKIVDYVYIMPCYRSLYNKNLVSGEHRLNMIKISNKHENVIPFDFEIKNKIEAVGTYNIMNMLKERLDSDLYFIIGLDNSQKVKSWKSGDKILNEHKFIVVPRLGTEIKDEWFKTEPHVYLKDYTPDDISSSNCKELLKTGENLHSHLDKEVLEYIISHDLYERKS
jgi:nicotinate-nucleotide adenylyltransferase